MWFLSFVLAWTLSHNTCSCLGEDHTCSLQQAQSHHLHTRQIQSCTLFFFSARADRILPLFTNFIIYHLAPQGFRWKATKLQISLRKLLNLVHQKPAATNLAKLTTNDPSKNINLQSTYDVDGLIVKLGSCSSLLQSLNSTLKVLIQKQKEQSWCYNLSVPPTTTRNFSKPTISASSGQNELGEKF